MEQNIEHNENEKRFEWQIGNDTAFVQYKLFEGGIAFMHTEVPASLEGKGVASALAKFVLDYAQTNKLLVKPYCPYIKLYIDRHPQYQANSMFHNKDLMP